MGHNHSNGKHQQWFTLACALGLTAGGLAEYTTLLPIQFAVPFYVLSYLGGGFYGFIDTIHHLRKFELNIDFLMIAAALGAAVLGEWIEGAILLFLFSISGTLETYALDKSRNAIHSLLELRPAQALLRKKDGTEIIVPIEQLNIGDIVIVKPGEYIPIDGKVVKGETSVDQSAITGESIPAHKEINDTVFSATLNEAGVIEVRVTKKAKDTTVSKIIALVESAQKNKAKTQRFLDTFEPKYAVTVVISVLLLIFVPWLIFGQNFDSTFYRAITVLVVASPCALIISTPASIISAIANGAKQGILFKGGVHVEQTERIDIIAFDKTGTLTLGKPKVTQMLTIKDGGEFSSIRDDAMSNMLSIAAGCELHSEHHLAKAILEKASELKVIPAKVENMRAAAGRGVEATLESSAVAVGNLKLFESISKAWDDKLLDKADELKNSGNTVIFVVKEKYPIGMIALADQVRPGAKEVIESLRRIGIKKIVMLTGDNEGVANTIASQLGFDELFSNLLPEQKVDKINQLKKEGTVAMIGDGVNDAPALALSDLGIAMGAAGTDVALETADIVLMGDDLSKLPYLIKLSRKAKKVVWQNIAFSLAVIAMLLIGVFFIDLPLTLGVIGHEGSTLLVVLNGLRLLGRNNISS